MIDPYVEHIIGKDADSVKPEDREGAIAVAREREAVQRKLRKRLESLQSGEVLPECEQCGTEFAGRSDARFCSTRCRVAAHRAQKKAEGQMTEAEKKAKADAKDNDGKMEALNKFYEDCDIMAWLAQRGDLGPKQRKKVVGWMRDSIERIEAL